MRRKGGCLRAVKECMPRLVLGDVLFGERQNELHWETVVKNRASQSLINTSSLVAQEPY
jgi:hypothetical protein